MKTKIMAVAIGVLFAWAGMAHDHPPPATCVEFCKDSQCSCVKGCEAAGKKAGDPCYMDCYQELLACGGRCNLTMEDCLRTDRCAKPRG